MTKRIIFAGPDNSGKTSIAKELSSAIGVPYFKDDNYKEQNFGSWNYSYLTCKMELDFIRQTKIDIILDRFIAPCEYAYGNVLRFPVSFDRLKYFDDKLSEMGFVIIYCFKTDYGDFKDEKIQLHQIEKIHEKYLEYLYQTKCKYLMLDTTDEDLDSQLTLIKTFIK